MKKTYKAYSVIHDLSKDAIDILKKENIEITLNQTSSTPNEQKLITLLQEYDILIIGVKTIISKELLNYIQTPKIIATLSIGVDHIAKEIRESNLVTVINIKEAIAISVAEHIYSLILTLNKRIYEANYLVLEQKGNRLNLHERPIDISGKKLGLIGAGSITKEVVKIAKAFHMEMTCYTKHPDKHQDLLKEDIEFKSLEEILKESDIINVSIPLNEETENLISKEKIEWIKPTATFINTSRIDVVDTKSLIDKAEKYDTFYVGLDIDLDKHQELLAKYRNNVIITPHIAGVSKEAIARMDSELATKITNYIRKGDE